MRVLTAQWGSASRVSPKTDVVTGEGSEAGESADVELLAKPMFIYVTDGAEQGSFDKIEKVVLDDNKVLVGMKAFKCVKMSPSDVNDDPLLSGHNKSKDTRYFLFVSRDYKKVTALTGAKVKAKTVYKTMKKFAAKAYKTKFDKNVSATLKLLIEFDKINNGLKILSEKEKREGADISKAEAKKIAKEKEELTKRQKEADALRDKLLTFELKTVKKTA